MAKIFIVRSKQQDYFPVSWKTDFFVKSESEILESDVIVKTITLDDILPHWSGHIPKKGLKDLVKNLLRSGFIYIDPRKFMLDLAENSCWLNLQELGVKTRILNSLNDGIKNIEKEEEFRHVKNPYKEINILGELASFDREQIAGIPGVGKKSMQLFDRLIYENSLHWGFNMLSIVDLAKYH